MAVSITGYSILVRNQTINERFPGTLGAYAALCPNRTFRTDRKGTRVSFLNWTDAELFLVAPAERGLILAEKGISADVAVISELDNASCPCDWLEHGTMQELHAAWLAGTEPGELVVADMERGAADLKQISLKELRESFDLVSNQDNVEAYRNRPTWEMLYVSRTSPQVPVARADMTSSQVAEHNRAFEQASRLVKDEIPLHGRQYMPRPGWWTRRKLQRALSLFARALELRPANWSAMWMVGMIYKRFRDYSTAILWFERASQVNPYHPDISREACSCALELGDHETAVSFAHGAVQLKPDDAGLRANLAVALFLGGRVAEAKAAIDQAVSGDPSDRISLNLRRTIEHFVASKEKPPSTLASLQHFIGKWG